MVTQRRGGEEEEEKVTQRRKDAEGEEGVTQKRGGKRGLTQRRKDAEGEEMINAKAQRGRGGREGNAETQRRGGRREGLTQRCGGAKARRKSGGSEAVYDAVDSAAQESLPEINHESQFLPAQ